MIVVTHEMGFARRVADRIVKEMRFSAADGEWRVAFAFDPARRNILPAVGDKSGGGGRRFYRALIAKADERFDRHLARLAKEGGS